MEIWRLIGLGIIIVIAFVLINKMYYSNQKHELAYRRKRYPKV